MRKALYMPDVLSSIASATPLSREQLDAVKAFREEMRTTVIPQAEQAILARQRAVDSVRSLALR